MQEASSSISSAPREQWDDPDAPAHFRGLREHAQVAAYVHNGAEFGQGVRVTALSVLSTHPPAVAARQCEYSVTLRRHSERTVLGSAVRPRAQFVVSGAEEDRAEALAKQDERLPKDRERVRGIPRNDDRVVAKRGGGNVPYPLPADVRGNRVTCRLRCARAVRGWAFITGIKGACERTSLPGDPYVRLKSQRRVAPPSQRRRQQLLYPSPSACAG